MTEPTDIPETSGEPATSTTEPPPDASADVRSAETSVHVEATEPEALSDEHDRVVRAIDDMRAWIESHADGLREPARTAVRVLLAAFDLFLGPSGAAGLIERAAMTITHGDPPAGKRTPRTVVHGERPRR